MQDSLMRGEVLLVVVGEITGKRRERVYQANFFSLIRTCVKISKRRNTKNDEETDHDYSICSEDEDEDVEDKVETRKPTRQTGAHQS